MPSAPRVTALVPAWNSAGFVAETLASLAAQSYENLRVLVSVDVSTDGTAETCEAFAVQDDRFEVIRQPRRLGWVGNVNHLIDRAGGEYAFIAPHDDLLEPSFVARLVARLEAEPGAVLAYCDVRHTIRDGRVRIAVHEALEGVGDPAVRAALILQKPVGWWIPYRGIFRTEVGKRIGGLRTHAAGEFGADWPWLLHLALYGEFVRVPELLCHKLFRETSLAETWRYSEWENLAQTLSCVREVARARVPLGVKRQVSYVLMHECRRRVRRLFRRGVQRTLDPGSWRPAR